MSVNQIVINSLSKVYDNGFNALKKVSLEVKQGEILAMLGPNGAGKTTLISIICGIVTPSSGTVMVDGFDILYLFLLADLFCCAFVLTVFYSFYNLSLIHI